MIFSTLITQIIRIYADKKICEHLPNLCHLCAYKFFISHP